MLDAVQHRGKTQHRFVDETKGIALGYLHRPAFLPPGTAPKPGWQEDNSIVVAVDGSIDQKDGVSTSHEAGGDGDANAAALRAVFKGSPEGSPADVDGTYNFIIWDRSREKLLVVADRSASKPLYYYHDEAKGLLIFASEAKAIYTHPAVAMNVDLECLSLYLALSYLPPPLAMIRGMQKILPAQMLSMDRAGSFKSEFYWRFPPAHKEERSIEEWVPLVKQRMRDSLRAITCATPKIAVNMSGGFDSSLLLAALKDLGGIECHTFTIGYGAAGPNTDLHWGEKTAAELDMPHHSLSLAQQEVSTEFKLRLLKQFDEPCDMHIALPDYLLSRAAAQEGLDSCLTGDKGESVFGSTGAWRSALNRHTDGVLRSEHELAQSAFAASPYITFTDQAKLLADGLPHGERLLGRFLDPYREIVPADNPFDYTSTILWLRMTYKGISHDVIPSLNGVETRFGYGGTGLSLFSRSIPGEHRGEGDSVVTKTRYLLSSAYGHMVPSVQLRDSASGRPGTPIANDIKFAGIRLLKETGWFAPAKLEKLIQKFQERTPEARTSLHMKTWLLFGLQVWLDTYVNRRDPFERLMRAVSH